MATTFLRASVFLPKSTPFVAPFQFGSVRHGSSLKETKMRIKSVNSIRKITKTMKMIASARLKGAQNRIEEARPFAEGAVRTLNGIKDLEIASKESKNLVITVSTDRGLCGSINSQIVRATKQFVDKPENGHSTIAILGEKAVGQLQRTHNQLFNLSVADLSKGGNNFFAVSVIIDKILSAEGGMDYDNIYVLYNRFNSVISFTPSVRHIPSTKSITKKVEQGMASFDDYEFENDDKTQHLGDLAQYHLAVTVYKALLENQASELGARMTSMDTATTNAGDMINRLTVKYNRGRQAAITTELSEIISGAEALKLEDTGAVRQVEVPLDSVRETLKLIRQRK